MSAKTRTDITSSASSPLHYARISIFTFMRYSSSTRMAADKDTCSSDVSWMLYSTVLYFLIFFVGILPHDLLRKPQTVNPQEIDLVRSKNAEDSQPRSSKINPAEKSSTLSSVQHESSNQSSFRWAVACQILHIYLVTLQYKYCNKLMHCYSDNLVQPVVAFWMGLAFLCAGGSVLYSLSAFHVDAGSPRTTQPT